MRVRLTFLPAALAAASLVLLAGCAPSGPGIERIVAVDFSQSQAVPDFDGGDYTQDDPDDMEEFIELLEEYDIDPATWRGQDSGCAGNRITQATLRYADSDLATQISVDSCNDGFEAEADELFTDWRQELSGE